MIAIGGFQNSDSESDRSYSDRDSISVIHDFFLPSFGHGVLGAFNKKNPYVFYQANSINL